VQIRNVTPDSFQIRFREWLYLDGIHATETISYLVLEAGRYTMDDGSIWEAGRFDLANLAGFVPQGFSMPFPNTPDLFLGPQTATGWDPVVVRAKDVDATGFQVAMFEEEARMADSRHGTESVGYLAIHAPASGGMILAKDQFYSYSLSRPQLDHRFSQVLDWLVKLEEERSADAEVWHVAETVSTLAIDGNLFGQAVSFNGKDAIVLRCTAP
jgi:hypothetical protein